MPCGWEAEFVRISATTPQVLFPLRWSFFWTISTVEPMLTEDRFRPSRLSFIDNSRISVGLPEKRDYRWAVPARYRVQVSWPCVGGSMYSISPAVKTRTT